ncbi:hypothetical protein LOK49_LG11G00432 [Camellia lanceoleosa]|uniref:Uncharacterized protein n=1 Tax=Camellia lanceoleosa TaxID=1840588 RepID=A0ACC0FYK8_9ERIC|nr:hypothetical protein LOK49_LG11G00432 [Camellia lanceoleosa]
MLDPPISTSVKSVLKAEDHQLRFRALFHFNESGNGSNFFKLEPRSSDFRTVGVPGGGGLLRRVVVPRPLLPLVSRLLASGTLS